MEKEVLNSLLVFPEIIHFTSLHTIAHNKSLFCNYSSTGYRVCTIN